MGTLIILSLYAIYHILENSFSLSNFLVVLFLLIVVLLKELFNKNKYTYILDILFLIVIYYNPILVYGIPVMFYNTNLYVIIGLVSVLLFKAQPLNIVFILLLSYMYHRMLTKQVNKLYKSQKEVYSITIRNKEVIEKQKQDEDLYRHQTDMEILKERTRIARDIHDNVGHILSRSLILVGAWLLPIVLIHKIYA